MIPKRLVKQMARQPDPLGEIVREGEHLAKQRRVRNTQKDLDDLRQSVRRLVGEWEKKSEDLWNNRPENDSRPKSEAISQCADELSALIDGKGENDG